MLMSQKREATTNKETSNKDRHQELELPDFLRSEGDMAERLKPLEKPACAFWAARHDDVLLG